MSNQIPRYPQLAVQDLYTLSFQAAFGSEQAVSDLAGLLPTDAPVRRLNAAEHPSPTGEFASP